MSNNRTLTVNRSTSTAHRLHHYDGVCNDIHGHNLDWNLTIGVTMENTDDDNMPVDFKDISDMIDELDHATLLNRLEVEAIEEIIGGDYELGDELIESFFGKVIWFDSDPTCEHIAYWMAERLVNEIDAIYWADVSLSETDKYTMKAQEHNVKSVYPDSTQTTFSDGDEQ